MAKIRSCIVDAQEYKFCPNCGDNADQKWRMIFCSDNCRAIKKVWDSYTAGKMTASEAKDELGNCDMTKMDSFLPYIKPGIDEIMGIVPVVEEAIPIIEEELSVIEETPIVEEEPMVVEQPFFYSKKKKNRKKDIVNDDLTVDNSTLMEE